MRGISWLAEELLASQERLCTLGRVGLDLVGCFLSFYHYKVLTKNQSVRLCVGEVCSLWRQTWGFLCPDMDVPWLRLLMAGLSLRRPGFGPRSVHGRFVIDTVALEEVLPVLRYFSVSIIPPVVIFIFTLLLPEGRTGDAWISSTEQCSFGNWGTLGRKTLHTFFFQYAKGLKWGGYMEILCNNLFSQTFPFGSNWGWRYIRGWLYLQATCLWDMTVMVTRLQKRLSFAQGHFISYT
jgi:hypothetical protein